jgi:hypothetical protein
VSHARRGGTAWNWSLATGAVVLVGVGLRLALHAGVVGDRSAAVMMALLGLAAWAAAMVLATPRTAFFVTLGLVTLLELAALPARTLTEYDERQAFYQTDQLVATRVSVSPPVAEKPLVLTLLVEPMFGGAQPRFGLAGEVGGASLGWDCRFRHGLQRLALPVPTAVVANAGAVDVRLHLTGSPSRESDYLLVYASSARGGFLVSLVAASDADQGATICALR